eukprot:TRINITY_DN8420_c0_g1_i1.p1 TRINITY_DN8420_c0_g1~~TRINITY_DN8420_c0_g1_i1.p1  ORF type:complete len:380 (+),score=26.06 TRINITY_DN8420_c0_g1_i1:268-1407(+)
MEEHNTTFLGWVISSYYISSIVAPAIMAFTAKHSVRLMSLFATLIIAISSLIYAVAVNKWMVLVARVLAGVGKGAVPANYLYLNTLVSKKERTSVIILANVWCFLGQTLGPGIAALFAFVPSQNDNATLNNLLKIVNALTLPGYFTAFCCLVLTALIFPMHRQIMFRHINNPSLRDHGNPCLRLMVVACIYLHFVLSFNTSAFITFVTPETHRLFDWGIKQNGLLFFCMGFILIPGIGISKLLSKLTNNRVTIIVGLLVFTSGFILISLDNMVLWKFSLGTALLSIGHAIAGSALSNTTSKCTPKDKLRKINSWLGTASDIGRICGPIYAAFMYHKYNGAKIAEYGLSILGATAFSVCIISCGSLKPLPQMHLQKGEER